MPPTSNEEIKRQHQHALLLVDGDGETVKPLPCAPQNELGEISLKDKMRPTYPYAFYDSTATKSTNQKQTPENESATESESDSESSDSKEPQLLPQPSLLNPICWSTRGFVDVSKIQDMVREGFDQDYRKVEELQELSPTNFWDPRNANKDNVTLTRPSHDAWGIGKIVLVFSDDFLTKVYQFPWWKDFETALKPITDVLFSQHGPNQKGLVVRALLASLPPASTIPVHHDSGEWVKTTHRVHVPILIQDPSRVVFRCGPSTNMLQRISCEPGHVFEINNQAKHAVSNCDHVHRVHLILDYVIQDLEDTSLEPIVLDAGEKLVQTRRSVDRLLTMVPRPTPSYIILGAQKAGTTSLYHYINEHPWVIKARRRETHCLDWRWNDKLKTAKKQREYCQKFFFTESIRTRPSCMTGDSTPSYLLDSKRVIPRLQRIFEWSHKTYSDKSRRMKFFVMMRDPVRRAASHYAMVTSTDGSPAQLKTRGAEWRDKTLWEVIQSELTKMKECGLIPYWDTEQGTVDQEAFDKFAGSPQESQAWNNYLKQHVPLNTGSYGLLTRGMYALQLRPWFKAFDRDQFLCIKLEAMNRGGVSETMKTVWAHLDLPNHPIEDESAQNSRQYDSTADKVNVYLQRFFEPHNRLLASVLQTKEEPTISEDWTNPWPYDLLEQQ